MVSLSKLKIEYLVGKDIILTNLENWVNRGTIWTPNDLDYSFVFKMFNDSIGRVYIQGSDLKFLKGNRFYYPIGKDGGLSLYHGSNTLCLSNEGNLRYKELSDFIDKALLN
jgi:hypothetical protein